MGGRDPREVELALHELARKELVRPARTSSMEGESRVRLLAPAGPGRLLLADPARAARAARHRAAAAWIERKAGERVEDLADVLAHHYLQALELVRAAGQDAEAMRSLRRARSATWLWPRERALPLDVEGAEQSLARALELAPAGHSERPPLLERWAQAAQQQGRLQETGPRSRRRSPSTASRARASPPGGC